MFVKKRRIKNLMRRFCFNVFSAKPNRQNQQGRIYLKSFPRFARAPQSYHYTQATLNGDYRKTDVACILHQSNQATLILLHWLLLLQHKRLIWQCQSNAFVVPQITYHRDLSKSYSYDIDPAQYSRLFNACFELADHLCVAQSQVDLTDDEVEKLSAHYVMQSINLQLNKHGSQSYAYQSIIMLVHHTSQEQGRLADALVVIDTYFQSKEGLWLEAVGESSFHGNFQKMKKPDFF